jgi:hypothetical protein
VHLRGESKEKKITEEKKTKLAHITGVSTYLPYYYYYYYYYFWVVEFVFIKKKSHKK